MNNSYFNKACQLERETGCEFGNMYNTTDNDDQSSISIQNVCVKLLVEAEQMFQPYFKLSLPSQLFHRAKFL